MKHFSGCRIGLVTLALLLLTGICFADDKTARDSQSPKLVPVEVIATVPRGDTVGDWPTNHPATASPDQILLTITDDPESRVAVQWRTSLDQSSGTVRFWPADLNETFPVYQPGVVREIEANSILLKTPSTTNQPLCMHHSAILDDLRSATRYAYQVGSSQGDWSEPRIFRTAGDIDKPFTFLYIGDAQTGFETWGKLIYEAHEQHPETAFDLLVGDLVNFGNDRRQWDDFLAQAERVYGRCLLVPAIGNHENHPDAARGDRYPSLYRALFALPRNGPGKMPPEHAYCFRYGPAKFYILDTNGELEKQAQWLDQQLTESDAKWNIVAFHIPVYPSHPKRAQPEIAENFQPILDKHAVPLVLQGHDHAYLRTHPMRAGEIVEPPTKGTIYIVAVSGTKMYPQGKTPYMDVAFSNASTYQVIDVDTDELRYRAFNAEHQVVDAFRLAR